MFFLLDAWQNVAAGRRLKDATTCRKPSLCLYKDRILE